MSSNSCWVSFHLSPHPATRRWAISVCLCVWDCHGDSWVWEARANMARPGRWLRPTHKETIEAPVGANGDTCNGITALDTAGEGGDHIGSYCTSTHLPLVYPSCRTLRTSHSITSHWHTQPQQAHSEPPGALQPERAFPTARSTETSAASFQSAVAAHKAGLWQWFVSFFLRWIV